MELKTLVQEPEQYCVPLSLDFTPTLEPQWLISTAQTLAICHTSQSQASAHSEEGSHAKTLFTVDYKKSFGNMFNHCFLAEQGAQTTSNHSHFIQLLALQTKSSAKLSTQAVTAQVSPRAVPTDCGQLLLTSGTCAHLKNSGPMLSSSLV